MTEGARNPAFEAARALEKQGQVDAAVKAYLRAGSVGDAARVLASAKRFADAGHLVMDSLGVGAALVGGLDADKRKLAARAAMSFAQAGDTKRAVELFLALGDAAHAAEAAERGGDAAEAARIRARYEKKSGGGTGGSEMGGAAARAASAEAGRVAYKAKRFAEAAQHFDDAGMTFEAAACFAEAGDKRRCLDAVVRVTRDHPKYRVAAAQAIRVSTELGAAGVDPRLDGFLAPFVADAPKDDREAEALYALARLYRTREQPAVARDLYGRLSAARPGYRDVAEQIAKLAGAPAGSPGVRRSHELLRAEAAAPPADVRNKEDSFPDLPDLPPPPTAPAPLQKTGYMLSTPSGRFPAVDAPRRMSAAAIPRVAPPAAAPTTGTLGAAGPASAALPASLSPTSLAIGSTVAERYQINAKIGEGGMAVVYRATDLELGEEIAIKLFLQPNSDPQLLARFKQELTLSRGLTHPNIVRLYDIGQHQGCRFLTMELLQGTDLGALLDGRPLEIARGLRYLIQAAMAMGLAHDKGVIHRDIKPANFFITKDDTLKVMDFGIAKRTAQASSLTQAGFIAGTPTYMSPEQINNFANVSHLTDIYALGIVAFEIFTGTVPFDHAEMMQLLMMHMTKAPPHPRAHNPQIPEALDALILNLLEKEPANRLQSCHELVDQLKAIAATL